MRPEHDDASAEIPVRDIFDVTSVQSPDDCAPSAALSEGREPTAGDGRSSAHRKPTARQLDVLRSVVILTASKGMPPTLRELCEVLGVNSTNCVAEHLVALEKRGLVERDSQLSRGLHVTERGQQAVGAHVAGRDARSPAAGTGATVIQLRLELSQERVKTQQLEREVEGLRRFKMRAQMAAAQLAKLTKELEG